MEPCERALWIGQEEDSEAAQHRRERLVRNIEVFRVHDAELGDGARRVDPLTREAHHLRRQVDADGPPGGSDPRRGRNEHSTPAACDVEDSVSWPHAGELDEPFAEVVVVRARDLVVRRRGAVEHAGEPRLGIGASARHSMSIESNVNVSSSTAMSLLLASSGVTR